MKMFPKYKGDKVMKKCFKILTIFVLSGSLFFTNIMSTFAAATVTKSTPYGTLYGSIGGGVSSIYGGKYCSGITKIDQKVNRIIFSVVAKKTSTGETIGDDRFSNGNATSVGGTFEVGGYSNTRLTFYGTHDVIHTNGYAVYTSTQY